MKKYKVVNLDKEMVVYAKSFDDSYMQAVKMMDFSDLKKIGIILAAEREDLHERKKNKIDFTYTYIPAYKAGLITEKQFLSLKDDVQNYLEEMRNEDVDDDYDTRKTKDNE